VQAFGELLGVIAFTIDKELTKETEQAGDGFVYLVD
jgi:hypothetical protein